VLVVFGVMLTSRQIDGRLVPSRLEAVWITVVTAILLAGLVMTFLHARLPATTDVAANSLSHIGGFLLTEFVAPFELASVLLLVVLLGAAYLARPKIPTVGVTKLKEVGK